MQLVVRPIFVYSFNTAIYSMINNENSICLCVWFKSRLQQTYNNILFMLTKENITAREEDGPTGWMKHTGVGEQNLHIISNCMPIIKSRLFIVLTYYTYLYTSKLPVHHHHDRLLILYIYIYWESEGKYTITIWIQWLVDICTSVWLLDWIWLCERIRGRGLLSTTKMVDAISIMCLARSFITLFSFQIYNYYFVFIDPIFVRLLFLLAKLNNNNITNTAYNNNNNMNNTIFAVVFVLVVYICLLIYVNMYEWILCVLLIVFSNSNI